MEYNLFLPVIFSEPELPKINALLSFIDINIKENKKMIITFYGNEIDREIVSKEININEYTEVFICEDTSFGFDENVYLDAISEHIRIFNPDIVIGLADSFYKSVLSRIAARFSSGMVSDCFDMIFDRNSKSFTFLKPAYGNNIHARISLKDSPIIFATVKVRQNIECAYKSCDNYIFKEINFTKKQNQSRIVLAEKILDKTIDNNLESAKIVIGVGRGIKKKENLRYAFELAKLLNAAVGVTRPLVDEGWVSKDYQIGQTGKMIFPDIYFAFGISGAAHHICGIGKPKLLIAVNNDKDAGIFNFANYGIVGDATEYLKKFIRKFQEKMSIC